MERAEERVDEKSTWWSERGEVKRRVRRGGLMTIYIRKGESSEVEARVEWTTGWNRQEKGYDVK